MPRPKKNTQYRISDEGIFPPILKKFLQKKGSKFPTAWGEDERQQWATALFLARIAANPRCFERLELGATQYDRMTYTGRMVGFYAADPDAFLEFLTFVRTQLKPRNYKALAKAYLREGAVQRYKKQKGKDVEPTDDELSAMLEWDHGVSIPSEHFGDARRALVKEDRDSKNVLKRIGEVDPFLSDSADS